MVLKSGLFYKAIWVCPVGASSIGHSGPACTSTHYVKPFSLWHLRIRSMHGLVQNKPSSLKQFNCFPDSTSQLCHRYSLLSWGLLSILQEKKLFPSAVALHPELRVGRQRHREQPTEFCPALLMSLVYFHLPQFWLLQPLISDIAYHSCGGTPQGLWHEKKEKKKEPRDFSYYLPAL